MRSATQVNNLNASLLGGYSPGSFQLAGSYATLGSNTFSATQSIGSGDLSVNSGNIDLPLSTGAAEGLVKAGNDPLLHTCCDGGSVSLGLFAGNLSSAGSANTAVGYTALSANTTGQSNSALGNSALSRNTGGSQNVAVGESALVNNQGGASNTALGATTLYTNTSGASNTAVGYGALNGNTTASQNTAVGYAALFEANNPDAASNTAVGANALYSTTTGQWNTALGAGADGSNITGSYNTFVGGNAGPGGSGAGNLSYVTAIGYGAIATTSNTVILGGEAPGDVLPQVGIGTSTPSQGYLLDVEGNVYVLENLVVGGKITGAVKDFKIDDPIDPAKDLYHASVESSEMKNLYDGVATLGSRGRAVVKLPDWFEALNAEFRYQLTAIGRPAPGLYIAREVRGNQFEIAGGKPGMKVSWTVTGVRHDAWAKAHPMRVEEPKSLGSQ